MNGLAILAYLICISMRFLCVLGQGSVYGPLSVYLGFSSCWDFSSSTLGCGPTEHSTAHQIHMTMKWVFLFQVKLCVNVSTGPGYMKNL